MTDINIHHVIQTTGFKHCCIQTLETQLKQEVEREVKAKLQHQHPSMFTKRMNTFSLCEENEDALCHLNALKQVVEREVLKITLP